MSHAEAIHTLQPAAGATDQIVRFAGSLRWFCCSMVESKETSPLPSLATASPLEFSRP